MRMIIRASLIVIFYGCTQKKWSKKSLVKECKQIHQENYKNEKRFTKEQVHQLCECVADKMMTKYKSEEETEHDSVGAKEIARDCKIEVLSE